MWSPPDPPWYNQRVYLITAQIPAGSVSTYSQIASMIPAPDVEDPEQFDRLGARWVGTALRTTPAGLDIPWQRVINSQGKISLPEGSPSADMQRQRLEDEGVHFSRGGVVDLGVYGWEGPDTAWLDRHELQSPRSIRPKGRLF